MPVGVTVVATETPPTTTTTYSTQNAFMPILCDWGPVGQPIKITNLGNFASQCGTPAGTGVPSASRTSTCALAYDAINELFNEDGTAQPTVYVSRVVHGTPVAASIALAPTAALTLTAAYVGAGGNGIYVTVANAGSTAVVTLSDSNGNTLAQSPSSSTLAGLVSWANATGYVTAVSSGSTLPSTASATAMTGGTDNRGSLAIGDVTTALNALPSTLGPGQVFMPGYTNASGASSPVLSILSGVWSALASHAQANNRVAICNLDDNRTAAGAVTDLGSFGTTGVAPYAGFWAGNRLIPGIAAATSRSVSPDAVIAGLCARIDAQSGNPNQAPMGPRFGNLAYATQPASFVSGSPYDTYSLTDLNTLNAAGINTFQVANGIASNYGFVSSELSTNDQIYWQFNHARLRMYIIAQSQIIGQNYVGAQIDPAGVTQTAFGNELAAFLKPLATAGALWAPPGTPVDNYFTVDTGSDVNTPATQAAGQLNASITCSFSYFAQQVTIQVNVVPITNLAV